MSVWDETDWFAVHTKPHQEHLAAVRLRQLDLETLLPRLQADQWVCGVTRLVVKPLFPANWEHRQLPGGGARPHFAAPKGCLLCLDDCGLRSLGAEQLLC